MGTVSDSSMHIPEPEEHLQAAQRGRKHFLTPRVLSSLDKWRITNHAAMHLISAILEALDHDIREFAFNARTLQRLREENRATAAESAKKGCLNLVIHFSKSVLSHNRHFFVSDKNKTLQ